MNNPFTAISAIKYGPFKRPGVYPAIPATWPNRAIRRAVQGGRTLPSEWAMFLAARPDLRKLIKSAKLGKYVKAVFA